MNLALTPKTLNIFESTMETKGFFQFEILRNIFVSSFRDGSTIIINMFTLSMHRHSDAYRRRILTSKAYHRAVRVRHGKKCM